MLVWTLAHPEGTANFRPLLWFYFCPTPSGLMFYHLQPLLAVGWSLGAWVLAPGMRFMHREFVLFRPTLRDWSPAVLKEV